MSDENKKSDIILKDLMDSDNILKVTNDINAIGSESQEEFSSKMEMIRATSLNLLSDANTDRDSNIQVGLLELREQFDEISPEKLSKGNFLMRMIGLKPSIPNFLKKMKHKAESINDNVKGIIDGLKLGQDQLNIDTAELQDLYTALKSEYKNNENNILEIDYMISKLENIIADNSNEEELKKAEMALKVATLRKQDLLTTKAGYQQSFSIMETTIENNCKLSHTITRTAQLTNNLLSISLSNQIALKRQEQMAQTVKATQNYLGDVMVTNANMVKENTKKSNDLFNDNIIDVEKLKEAHSKLIEATEMAKTEEFKRIETAKSNIKLLEEMNNDLDIKLNADKTLLGSDNQKLLS